MSQKIEDEQNNWRNFSPGITWELGKLQNVTGKVYVENIVREEDQMSQDAIDSEDSHD